MCPPKTAGISITFGVYGLASTVPAETGFVETGQSISFVSLIDSLAKLSRENETETCRSGLLARAQGNAKADQGAEKDCRCGRGADVHHGIGVVMGVVRSPGARSVSIRARIITIHSDLAI